MPSEPAEDVEELRAWCGACGEDRRFVKGSADFAALEEQAAAPNVQRALEGEPGWLCTACGAFRRTLVEEQAYPVAFANVAAVREPPEEVPGGEGVSEDLALRAASEGQATLGDPATEPEHLREDPTLEGGIEADAAGDVRLEEAMLEGARRTEAGEEDLRLRHGPRGDMPPPARVPRRDPTARDLDEP